MTLYKLFKDIFYDTMTRHGFIHQGNVFMRVIGGEIMQAVTVKPIASYAITCDIFPFFDAEWDVKNEKIKGNPYWAEAIPLTFHGYRDFPYKNELRGPLESHYLLTPFLQRDDMIEMTQANLEKAREIMEDFYIPMFDQIVDFLSYIAWKSKPDEEVSVLCRKRISPEALGCKAYYDGNFNFVEQYLEADRKAFQQRHLELRPMMPMGPALEDYDNRIMASYKIVYEWMKSGDVSWVPDYIAQETEKVKQKFLERYSKLKVFFNS